MKNIRVVLNEEEANRFGVLLECFRYAGLIQVHRSDETGMCFDIMPPDVGPDLSVNHDAWAQQNAERISSFGFNAVAAPEWKEIVFEHLVTVNSHTTSS